MAVARGAMLSEADLQEVLDAMTMEGTGWVIGHRLGDPICQEWRRDSGRLSNFGTLPAWDRGRVFASDWELRFRRSRSGFRVLLVHDGAAVPSQLTDAQSLELTAVDGEEPLRLYLWGELQVPGGFWYQDRIPRKFDYPGRQTTRKRVLVRLYRAPDGTEWTRFASLEDDSE